MEDKELIRHAMDSRKHAYAPYSGFHVGAALITASGKVFTGCNVENASYGAACCAERTAVFKAVSEGESKIIAVAVSSGSDHYTYPCGICRQVISEFAGKDCRILCSNKNGEYTVYTLEQLLPNAFGKDDLHG